MITLHRRGPEGPCQIEGGPEGPSEPWPVLVARGILALPGTFRSACLFLGILCLTGMGCNDSSTEKTIPTPFEIGEDDCIQQGVLHDIAQVIQENNIKTLIVQNCIEGGGCYKDAYTFNDCGEVKEFYPAMVGWYMEFEFDASCRISKKLTHSGDSEPRVTTYTYLENDSVLRHLSVPPIAEGEPHYYDTLKFKIVPCPPENPDYNEAGQLLRHDTGDLFFPCGYEFRGKHTANYTYTPEGLINQIVMRDSLGKMDVTLKYHFSKSDTFQSPCEEF